MFIDDETELSPEEHAELWREWVKNGPDGPISDEVAFEGGKDFPDDESASPATPLTA